MLPSLLYSNAGAPHARAADNKGELCADTGLDAVLNAMARGNAAIRDAAQSVLFELPAIETDDVLFRQRVLRDMLGDAGSYRELHALLESGLAQYEDARNKSQPGYSRFTTVTSRLHTATALTAMLFALADDVRKRYERLSAGVASDGLHKHMHAFERFYSAEFVRSALRENADIARISEEGRVTLGARLGHGLKGCGYVIRAVNQTHTLKRAFKHNNAAISLDSIAAQSKAVELRDAALLRILGVLITVIAQTADHLKWLLYELSFYIGCINLHEKMTAIGVPICYPVPSADAGDTLRFSALVDISLALNHNMLPVANTLDLSGMRLVIITGANQGGKSTFLRSVGCAQLMAQCGMFVAASDFRFSVRSRVFTHFCKPEDASMDSGKLDEELARLDNIVDKLEPHAMVLMNESFASTAEREGAAIAREITGALYDLNVKVLFVTHLYDYAHAMELEGAPGVLLLRAERCEDGSRTFVIRPGLSLPTSFAMDLYSEIIDSR